ncbi:sensor domain-containing diguanylate cyclase [Granulicella sibirica]|uniref:diguanylate cyclase n=1 Tax=Granulicella sibirica TaxID=2479048 RepID=A0A4Q0SYI9_9BACT|nr:sensor domain-containing diguanylate cyclase [Granulicella sibirica]RXH56265.1 diguanylate cyclase/phosphodiesterase (GGDEF & EAL domains) with PAS/PAC sensor(s) [Granulicella sibirica]
MMPNDNLIFRKIVEHSIDVIFRLTLECEVLYASPSVRRQLGYEPAELLGRVIFDLIYEPDREVARKAARRSVQPGVENSPGTQRWIHKDGHLVWIEVNGRTMRNEDGPSGEIVIFTRDISDRKALEQKLEELAVTDSLTGLRNRRGFDERLGREWERTLRIGSPISLLLLDLDHFKHLNDSYGHSVGDDCLRAAALAFTTVIRRNMDVVARYGGEELAAILPDTDLEGAIQVAGNVCRSIAELRIPHRRNIEGRGIMTASIGVASVISRHGTSLTMPEVLVKAADSALYRAKQHGRNRVEANLITDTSRIEC